MKGFRDGEAGCERHILTPLIWLHITMESTLHIKINISHQSSNFHNYVNFKTYCCDCTHLHYYYPIICLSICTLQNLLLSEQAQDQAVKSSF